MSQPKHRRCAARRRAQAERAKGPPFWMHVNLTGEARNPLGARASLDMVIAVGFGSAQVWCDAGVQIDGDQPMPREPRGVRDRRGYVTLRRIEKYIRRHPKLGRQVWHASLYAPLWEAEWERQGPGRWICTKAGEGFA